MKIQATSLLVLTTLIIAAKAAWEAPSNGDSWQTLCADGQTSKFNPSHVCFTSRLDETHYDGSVSYFRGYHNGGHGESQTVVLVSSMEQLG